MDREMGQGASPVRRSYATNSMLLTLLCLHPQSSLQDTARALFNFSYSRFLEHLALR